MSKPPTPTITGCETEFATPWFEVIGKNVTIGVGATERYYAIRPGSDYVVTLAVTDQGAVPLVRQYRPAVEEYTLELPAGHVDAGEEPQTAAIRELREETGCRASHVDLMGVLAPDTGRMANRMWCYIAQAVPAHPDPEWKPETGIDVVMCPIVELMAWVADGRLRHAHDLAAIALAVSQRRWS